VIRHHHVRIARGEDMGRLARSLSNNTVAVVLAGGGARGFAHLGVMRALREAGLPVDAVGGASFGALAATGLARGLSHEQIFAEQHHAFTQEDPLNDYTIPIVSLVGGQRLDSILEKYLPMDIEDLWLPFFAISSDLSANQVRVHDRGPLWRAIRASVSVPGVLPPALEDGHLLVDGGILNNLPVDVMRERMRGRIIAVDLAVGHEFTLATKEIPRGFEYLASRVLPWREPLDAPTISRVIIKATTLASRKEVGNARKAADLYLTPPVEAYDFLDWHCLREIVDVGYAYALPRVEAWGRQHCVLATCQPLTGSGAADCCGEVARS
jgi:predicted acylesterase/phospholipase RssA